MCAAANNPLREHPGYRRALNAILDAVEKDSGRIPGSKTLRDLDAEAIRGIKNAFWSNHLEVLTSTSMKLYPKRIIRDLHADDAEKALATWYSVTDREPRDPRGETEQAHTALVEVVGSPTTPTRSRVLALIASRKGWPTRKLRSEGHEAARTLLLDFLAVTDRLPCSVPTKIRTFSASYLSSSKSLDPGTELYRHVADFLIDESTDVADEVDTATERRHALERNNLLENPASAIVLAYGELALLDAGRVIQSGVEHARRGVATVLSYQQVDRYQPTATAPRVLTIENETSFYDLCAQSPADTLLVCTRGQPSTAAKLLLTKLAGHDREFLHWGDIDAGGYNILDGVRRLAGARPILMDVAALRKYGARLVKLDDDKRDSITRFLAVREEPALRAVLELDGWLEQESIPIDHVSRALEVG